MTSERWEPLYRRAYERGIARVRALHGVCCAFHSVIDGVIHLTPDLIQPVLDSDPSLKIAAKKGCDGSAPAEILTPADFVQGMFYSLKRGGAMQRMIREASVYEWALRMFGPGELRLGGTSANMARSLAPLGIPVTVYANPLTVELAELFGGSHHLKLIAKGEHGYELEAPLDAAREKGVFAIHWIFEYGTDFRLDLDGVIVQPHRANRYIPSWNPANNQFKMDPVFAEGFRALVKNYSHLLFSGFHILSETYPDGSTCEDVVRPLGEYLDSIKQAAPELKIHLEFASIGSARVRNAAIDHVFPHVDSLGLNETELPLLLDNLGEEPLANSLREKPRVEDFLTGCRIAIEKTGVGRVHFHNLGYYLCLEKQPWTSPHDSRDALLFAAVLAAARAQNGLFKSLEDSRAGFEARVAALGLDQLNRLADSLQQPSLAEEGLADVDGLSLAAIPTRLVEKPLFTVGLGDTISAGAFLTE
ncbi:MAG: hypothetical protein GC154_15795 [bacterium]|nr:hypothetical protein [bacterium]